MKIALMTNNYKPFVGGVPISVERLAEGLRKEGHEVVVFAPTYIDGQRDSEEENGVFRYHSILKGVAGGAVIPNPIDPKIEREFKEGHFDIIHVHHPIVIGNTAIYLSKKYKVPLTFTYHTRYEQYLHYLKPVLWMEKGAGREGSIHKLQKKTLEAVQQKLVPGYIKSFIKYCHHVFTPTEGMRDYLRDICNLENSQISVLPTGLKEESYYGELRNAKLLREKYNTTDCPLFISVSRLAHEKNIPFLLHTLAYYKMLYKKPFRMLLVGEGPNREEYENMVHTLRLDKEIIFTGLISNEELPDYYRAAELFLFASKTETQGIVILESMAAETPVIALNATGVKDLVVNGVNGYLVGEEVSEFAEKIHQVMQNNELRAELNKGAFETASSYREDRIAKRAAAVYQIVIEDFRGKQLDSIRISNHAIKMLSEL